VVPEYWSDEDGSGIWEVGVRRAITQASTDIT
jgi:hypothetical protein